MNQRIIEKVLEFQASPDRVWKAITEPEELSKWFGHRTELGELLKLLGGS